MTYTSCKRTQGSCERETLSLDKNEQEQGKGCEKTAADDERCDY